MCAAGLWRRLDAQHRAVGIAARVAHFGGQVDVAVRPHLHLAKPYAELGEEHLAALGDLYQLSGRDKEAAAQYELVAQIGRLSELNGVLYNRQLALFWADHDLEPEAAYAAAAKEYEVRKDVYGADAVA